VDCTRPPLWRDGFGLSFLIMQSSLLEPQSIVPRSFRNDAWLPQLPIAYREDRAIQMSFGEHTALEARAFFLLRRSSRSAERSHNCDGRTY